MPCGLQDLNSRPGIEPPAMVVTCSHPLPHMMIHRLDIVQVAFIVFSFDLRATTNLSDLPSDKKLGAEQG